MTQGNKFGRTGGRWMTATKLRALFNAGLTFDEIATANERSEGWKPSRSAVKRKFESMGEPARRPGHADLLPWRIAPEHNNDLLRHMLQAESRKRRGGELSDTDRKLTARLNELLFGRGKLMVVGYHREVGFFLAERQDFDEDIIRHPRSDAYSTSPRLRRELAAPASGDVAPESRSGTRTRRPRTRDNTGQTGEGARRQRAASDPRRNAEESA